MAMVVIVIAFIKLTVKGLTIIAIGWTRGNKKALASTSITFFY